MNLFDSETGLLLLDQVVMEMPSFKRIMADNIITYEEVQNQSNVVIELFKRIEAELDENSRDLVVKTIAELAVLYQLNSLRECK